MLRRLAAAAALSCALILGAAAPAMAQAITVDGDAAQQLADRYAPLVVVRSQADQCGAGEPYLPTQVDAVLGQPDVVLRGPSGETVQAPTAADLAGKGDGWYLDLPGNPLSPGCSYEQWWDRTSDERPATVYARVAQDADAGKTVVQYWFFWVYNDWNDKHEGDWEMIQVVLPAPDAETALGAAPESIAFAQHEGSETAPWGDSKVHADGDHVVVYPAMGSHAAYYTQAQWFGKSAAAGFGCDDTRSPGDLVRPEVVLLPEQATGEFAWLGFTGRWGEKAPSFNNGPTGPITKTQWDEPVGWQVEEGRAGAVPLPPAGGPAVTGFCSLTQAGSLLFIQFLDAPVVVGVVVGILLLLLVLVIVRTDFFNNDDPELDRERKAGQIAVASVDVMRKRLDAFWVSSALVVLGVGLNLLLGQWLLRAQPGEDLADVDGIGDGFAGTVFAFVASFLLLPVIAMAMATCVEIVDAVATHREITAVEAFRRVLVHPGGWFVAMLAFVVVSVLASTWWLLPLALLLLAIWAVALPATELEDQGMRAGLRRSRLLTKGRRLRGALLGGFLVWMGFSLPSFVGAIALLLTGLPFWATNLIAMLVAALLVPAAAIGLTLLYYDLRHRRASDDRPAEATA